MSVGTSNSSSSTPAAPAPAASSKPPSSSSSSSPSSTHTHQQQAHTQTHPSTTTHNNNTNNNPSSSVITNLQTLQDRVTKGQGSAGVLGVALTSPLFFSIFPWLVAVLLVFLVGIAIEVGPGLALEYLITRRRERGRKESDGEGGTATAAAFSPQQQQQQEGLLPHRGDSVARSTHTIIATSHISAPTTTNHTTINNNNHNHNNSPASSDPASVARRDFSLFGAHLDIKDFRVVEGNFASYKVAVTCKGNQWSVWKRYSDFEDLRERLLASLASNSGSGSVSVGVNNGALPLIPPKTLFKNLSPKFLSKRAESLQAFMREVMKRRDLSDDPTLRRFVDAGVRASEGGSEGVGGAAGGGGGESKPLPRPFSASSLKSEGEEEEEEGAELTHTERGGHGSRVSLRGADGNEVEEEEEEEGEGGEESSSSSGTPSSVEDDPDASSAALQEGEVTPPAGTSILKPGQFRVEEEEEEGSECDSVSDDEEEEEDDDDELRRSRERPALSIASTDDGEDDEERVKRTANSILETMRELSTHSPSEWDTVGGGTSSSSSTLPSLPTLVGGGEGTTTTPTATATTDNLPLPSLLPPPPPHLLKTMSLDVYQQHSLRLQHPTAFYDPGQGNTFHVRGHRYLHDKRKYPAGPPMGKLLYALVFKIPPSAPGGREDHIASRGKMALLMEEIQQLKGRDGLPPFCYIVNIQVPGTPPLSFVQVFALPRKKKVGEDGAAFWNLFERFCEFPLSSSPSTETHTHTHAAATATDGGDEGDDAGRFPLTDFRNKRFKLIPSIVDGPSMIRWAVGNKPTILGQKLTQRYFRSENYVEVDVDVASSAVASQIVSLCRGYAKYLKVEMGFVLQGEDEREELPEKLVGTVGIVNLDIDAYGVDSFLN